MAKVKTKNSSFRLHNSYLKKGFTLIELLVSMSIIAILTTIGIAKYRDFSQRETLRQAAQNVKAALQEAQKRAQAGEMPAETEGVNCVGGTFVGWEFETGTTQYWIQGRCEYGPVSRYFHASENYNLPEEVKFDSVYADIIFKPLGEGVNLPGGASSFSVILNGEKSSISVIISQSGEIKIGEETVLPPSPSPLPSPTPCYSGSTPVTTGWGEGTAFSCDGSDKRCLNGSCVTCGGYLYDDGCSGCSGQGGQGCWYLGALGESCTSACSAHGGCVGANWNDNTSCTVQKNLASTTCNLGCVIRSDSDRPSIYNISGPNRCSYRSGLGSQSCSAADSQRWRACVCEY